MKPTICMDLVAPRYFSNCYEKKGSQCICSSLCSHSFNVQVSASLSITYILWMLSMQSNNHRAERRKTKHVNELIWMLRHIMKLSCQIFCDPTLPQLKFNCWSNQGGWALGFPPTFSYRRSILFEYLKMEYKVNDANLDFCDFSRWDHKMFFGGYFSTEGIAALYGIKDNQCTIFRSFDPNFLNFFMLTLCVLAVFGHFHRFRDFLRDGTVEGWPLPGAWVAALLGVYLGSQVKLKLKIAIPDWSRLMMMMRVIKAP